MRNTLLATTAVAGAALFASAAMAQMPVTVEPPRALAGSAAGLTVRLGGYFDFRAGLVNDDADRNAVTVGTGTNARRFGRQRVDFQSDMELNVFVDGKASNGLQYGLVMEFQVDNVGAGSPGSTLDTDEFYGYVSHPTFGTLRFGDEDNAANLLQVRAPLIRGADTDNYWDEFTFRRGADGSPSLFTALGDGGDNTKIIYLSPQFFGFDFGISYAPNTGEGERFALGTGVNDVTSSVPSSTAQRDRSARRNEISAGIRYRGTFGGIGIAASFGALRSDSQARYAAATTTPLHSNITAYSAGLQISAHGFTLGGQYNWGDYTGVSVGTTASLRGRDQSRHWVIGATYTIPGMPLQLGAFYGEATQDNGTGFEDRKQTIYSGGVNYTVAPGMTAYLTYTHLRDQNEVSGGAYVDNNLATSGSIQRDRNLEVYMAGFRIAF